MPTSQQALEDLADVTRLSDGEPIVSEGCFGWLHASWGDIGVLICPGLGQDGRNAYRSLGVAADALARRGYPTLRLAYPGTGDGEDLDGREPCAAWLGGITAAAERLRATGVRKIVFCGVRLGALLACSVAAKRDDVCGLVLLEPVASGAAYLRQLRITGIVARNVPNAEDLALEVDGVPLPDRQPSLLTGLDLFSLHDVNVDQVLVLTASPRANAGRLADHLRLLGSTVTQAQVAPFAEYGEDGSVHPDVDLGPIHDWLSTMAPPARRATAFPPLPVAELVTAAFVEQPIRFGPRDRLFGILCRPRQEVVPGFVLMIGNEGAVPHQGFARFHVMLARRIAAAGFASLRFDFAGLGDSRGTTPGASSHIYATDRVPDIAAAIDALHALGYRHFTAGGLCSGAFHAWQAAQGDDRIGALILLNPATFSWSRDQDFQEFVSQQTRSVESYLRTLRAGDGWRRLWRGELKLGLAARTIRSQVLRRAVNGGRRVAAMAGHSPGSRPSRIMRGLGARGVRVLLAVGSLDGDHDVISSSFGNTREDLLALADCVVREIPGADHHLSLLAMQEAAACVVLDFLDDVIAVHGSAPRIAGSVARKEDQTI